MCKHPICNLWRLKWLQFLCYISAAGLNCENSSQTDALIRIDSLADLLYWIFLYMDICMLNNLILFMVLMGLKLRESFIIGRLPCYFEPIKFLYLHEFLSRLKYWMYVSCQTFWLSRVIVDMHWWQCTNNRCGLRYGDQTSDSRCKSVYQSERNRDYRFERTFCNQSAV